MEIQSAYVKRTERKRASGFTRNRGPKEGQGVCMQSNIDKKIVNEMNTTKHVEWNLPCKQIARGQGLRNSVR